MSYDLGRLLPPLLTGNYRGKGGERMEWEHVVCRLTGSWRTKAAGENAFLRENPQSTIIRPSIVVGPGDSFFNVSSTSHLSSW